MTTKQFLISGTPDAPSTSVTEYAVLLGTQFASTWVTTENAGKEVVSTPGTLTNFKVGVVNAPGVGASWTFTIRKGASNGGAMGDTALSVTISDSAVLSALDTDSVAVVAGDIITISATPSGPPAAAGAVHLTVQFTPATVSETLLLSNSAGSNLVANDYQTLIGDKTPDATEFDAQTLFPTAGVLKNLYVELNNAPGVGTSRVFTVLVNGSAPVGGLVVTISDAAKVGNDTANSIVISAGDKVTIQTTVTGSPLASLGYFGATFVPTVSGEWITSATTDDVTSSTAVEYQTLNCGDSALNNTDSEHYNLAQATTAKKIYVNLGTAPGASNTWTFTLRKNGTTDTALTVSVADSNTNNNAAVDVAISDNDLLDIAVDARAGTATSTSQIAILFYNAPVTPVTVTSILKMGRQRVWDRRARLYKSLSLRGG